MNKSGEQSTTGGNLWLTDQAHLCSARYWPRLASHVFSYGRRSTTICSISTTPCRSSSPRTRAYSSSRVSSLCASFSPRLLERCAPKTRRSKSCCRSLARWAPSALLLPQTKTCSTQVRCASSALWRLALDIAGSSCATACCSQEAHQLRASSIAWRRRSLWSPL